MTDERDAEIKRLRDFETYWNCELVSVIGRMINEAKWLRPRHAELARHPDGGRLVVAMLIVALGAMALTVEVIHGRVWLAHAGEILRALGSQVHAQAMDG